MIMEGCQSKSKELSLEEKICPNCGNTVEIFSVDTEAVCDRCGFVIYNDMLSCVHWCKYARKCVSDAAYERIQDMMQQRKERERNVHEA